MTRNVRRPWFALFFLLLLGGAQPTRALALDLLEDVSKERAKELGITVEMKQREKDVWVQVHYKPTGAKKEFKYTHLDVTQGGEPLVGAYLMPWRPTPESMRFDFYIDPAALPNASVTITVWQDPITGHGYWLKMKDFMEPAAAR